MLDLHNISDEELWRSVNLSSTQSPDFPKLAHAELQRRAAKRVADEVKSLNTGVERLCGLIERFDRSSTRLSKVMLALTFVIGVLTVVQVVIGYLAYCNS